MPGVAPLYNTKLQSSLDLNSQALIDTNAAKRFILKDIGANNKIIDASDMGRLLKLTGIRVITLNNNISGIEAGDTFTVTNSTNNLSLTGSATRYYSFYDTIANSALQFIYIGDNIWIILNTN